MGSGWIRLHRKITEWRWFNDDKMLLLWIHILLSANWEETVIGDVTYPAGSFRARLEELCPKMPKSTVSQMLARLGESGQIKVESLKRNGVVITVLNWGEYQENAPATKLQQKRNKECNKQTPDNLGVSSDDCNKDCNKTATKVQQNFLQVLDNQEVSNTLRIKEDNKKDINTPTTSSSSRIYTESNDDHDDRRGSVQPVICNPPKANDPDSFPGVEEIIQAATSLCLKWDMETAQNFRDYNILKLDERYNGNNFSVNRKVLGSMIKRWDLEEQRRKAKEAQNARRFNEDSGGNGVGGLRGWTSKGVDYSIGDQSDLI